MDVIILVMMYVQILRSFYSKEVHYMKQTDTRTLFCKINKTFLWIQLHIDLLKRFYNVGRKYSRNILVYHSKKLSNINIFRPGRFKQVRLG